MIWLLVVKAPSPCPLPPANQHKAVVRSVDLFEFYPVSREIFFGLLVCVWGKQYGMESEKNSVTDARYA